MDLTRRQFTRLSALAGISCFSGLPIPAEEKRYPVAIVKTEDRKEGIAKAVKLLDIPDFRKNDIFFKGSFNSPHPFPATTHPDAFTATVQLLRAKGARTITLVERSGMGDTKQVMETLHYLDRIREMELSFLPLEDLPMSEWRHFDLPGSHWEHGIDIPGFLSQDNSIIQLCNLKTHRFGGLFSASLKNSVGLIAKYDRSGMRNYMMELHASPFQGQMIAEVNQTYSPELIIMDAVQAFVQGGPEKGVLAYPGLIAASQDRIALDAVGVAILQLFGAGYPFGDTAVFEFEPLKRAAELKLGAQSVQEIQLITDDDESSRMALRLQKILAS